MPEWLNDSDTKVDSTVSFYEKYNITDREKEVTEYLIKGLRYDDIAKGLYISKSTVKTHIRHIYNKVNVSNKVELLNIIYNE